MTRIIREAGFLTVPRLAGPLALLLCATVLVNPARAGNIAMFGQCPAETHSSVERLLPLVENKPYLDVRSQIVSHDWRPAPSSETSGWRTDPDHTTPVPYNPQEQPFADRKFSELESCAEDRDAPCIFLFQDRANDRLEIFTSGEESPRSHAIVLPEASLACPPGKIPP